MTGKIDFDEVRRVEVINWFLGLSREMYLNARATMHRRVTGSDMGKWADFEVRMRQIGEEIGVRYAGYDIVRKNGLVWYYNPAGFMMYVDANIDIIKRVPSFSQVVSAWAVMKESERLRVDAWADGRLTGDKFEVRLRSIMEKHYEQLKMSFAQ